MDNSSLLPLDKAHAIVYNVVTMIEIQEAGMDEQRWTDTVNEGGEGFNPHRDSHERLVSELEAEQRMDELFDLVMSETDPEKKAAYRAELDALLGIER